MPSALIQLIYFLLPAAFANMSAWFSAKALPKLNYPMDLNVKIFGKRLLGNHKTIRGLIFGLIGGIIIGFIQWLLYAHQTFREISLIDYTKYHWLLVGTLLGLGAILGDAIKSIIKRQAGIHPGESFMPFDQIDWIIGAVILIIPVYTISALYFLILVILYFLIHIIVRYIGYRLKLERKSL